MDKEFKKATLNHLKRAEGMLRKVTSMVEEDKYCIDVLQQSLATIGFIKSANKTLLENHLNCCFKKGMESKSGKKQKELIDELIRIINKI